MDTIAPVVVGAEMRGVEILAMLADGDWGSSSSSQLASKALSCAL